MEVNKFWKSYLISLLMLHVCPLMHI